MRAASLLAVLVAAKAMMLAGHHVAWSWWSPAAYLWQDAVVVLVFAALEYGAGKHECWKVPGQRKDGSENLRCRSVWGAAKSVDKSVDAADRSVCATWGNGGFRGCVVWMAYWVAVMYVAANIPVARVLSTPLTWPMIRAAGGPLADSIRYYATWQNAMLVGVALAVAAAAPRVLRKAPRVPVVVGLLLCAVLGPAGAAHVDTRGFDRNAWTALIPARVQQSGSVPASASFRAGFDQAPGRDLSEWRGAAAGRNIVLISLESTAAQYLGIYGPDPDPMPNLSRLARQAIVFENAYAVYPESIKGLFSILCATYPSFGSDAGEYQSVECQSIAASLGEAGYRTAMFHSGRFGYLGMEAVIRHRGFEVLEDAGDIGGNHQSSFGVDEPSTVARVLRWIDGLPAGQRFFVTYLPIAGHHPYETPDGGPFPAREDFGRYRNALHYGDVSLGALMAGLRERGLEEKTLWIVMGDHGEAFGQHDGNYGHTFQLYEENVRVPFLVAAPGLIPRQVRAPQVVSLVDTAPTVLELAGVRAPGNYQGRSMLSGEPRMALFFADYSLGLLGLRDGPRKFIYELNSGHAQMFDLERDPGERVNLSAEHRPQAMWYERNLRNWNGAQKAFLWSGFRGYGSGTLERHP